MTRTYPVDRYGLIHRGRAKAAGYTDYELNSAVNRGELIKLFRGVLIPADDRDALGTHRSLAIAAYLGAVGDKVLSHESAAVLLGLEMLKPDLTRAQLTTGYRAGGRKDAHRHMRVGVIPDEQRTVVDGIAVTSLERTAVDVACTTAMGFAGALAVFDSALRNGADAEEITRLLKRKRRGVECARRAFDFADASAENPGESWGRAQMIEAGLPVPRLQHMFYDERGKLIARTDYDWEGQLVAEFDGDVKYRKLLRPGENATDVVTREKKREDNLRRIGVMVIRFTWRDLEAGRVADMVREWLDRLELTAA